MILRRADGGLKATRWVKVGRLMSVKMVTSGHILDTSMHTLTWKDSYDRPLDSVYIEWRGKYIVFFFFFFWFLKERQPHQSVVCRGTQVSLQSDVLFPPPYLESKSFSLGLTLSPSSFHWTITCHAQLKQHFSFKAFPNPKDITMTSDTRLL